MGKLPPKPRKHEPEAEQAEEVIPPGEQPQAGKDARWVGTGSELLTPKQREGMRLLSGTQRHTALVGGARSGKTVLFVRGIVIRAVRAAGSRHGILRLNSNAIWPSIGMDTLPFVFKRFFPKLSYVEHRQDGYFMLPNGSEIWLGGLDDPKRADKILGREFATMYFNECSQIAYPSIVTALSRLAQNLPGLKQRAYYDLNPVGKGHWSNLLFGEHKDPVSKKVLPNPEQYSRMFMNPEDNRQNLTPEYIQSLDNMPTRQRQRFYLGQYVDETENALWTFDIIERGRILPGTQLPDMLRIVVAIDPSGARNELDVKRDAIGIIVAGLGSDGHGYVLADLTRLDSPKGWARAAINGWRHWGADVIIGETNFGGAMVGATIAAEDPSIPFKEVTASRGKVVRAEPISTLYGDPQDINRLQTKVHHVGNFVDLEDEMTAFTDLGYVGERSPNRADALVWALTELMLGESATNWLKVWKEDAANMKALAAGMPPPVSPAEAAQLALRVAMQGKPGMMFAPTKEHRYLANPEGVLVQFLQDGRMLPDVLADHVDILSRQGCTVIEEQI